MSFETFIAWRYFKAKRKQALVSLITLISLAGVAVGVAALIVVLAVMSGVGETWKEKILGVNAHVVVLEYGHSMEDYRQVVQACQGVEGVTGAEPFIYSQVMLSAFSGVSGAILRGIDPVGAEKSGVFAANLASGSLADLSRQGPGESPGIILGAELALNLSLGVGDSLRVISPLGRVTPLGGRAPATRQFTVRGIFKSGMYEYDNTLAYVSLSQAQDFLNLGDTVTGVEVRVADVYRADRVKAGILDRLDGTYWARDWMQMNRNLFFALSLEKFAMFVILMLIVFVAALNIISALIMVVTEKTRDIAILKSMGATDGSVMRIFIFQGMTIGILGSMLGLAGGVGLGRLLGRYQFIKLPADVYYIDTLPVRIEALDVALVVGVTLAISLVATIYPAWRAARLNPVEALRYE